MKFEFQVLGVAAPQGSMYARYSPKLGRAFVVPDNKKTGPWRQEVAVAAMAVKSAMGASAPWPTRDPVERPTGHHGAKGLRPNAPLYPSKKPDLSKLVRAVEDALTGIVYDDDARIVRHIVEKLYADGAMPPHARVEIQPLPATCKAVGLVGV